MQWDEVRLLKKKPKGTWVIAWYKYRQHPVMITTDAFWMYRREYTYWSPFTLGNPND